MTVEGLSIVIPVYNEQDNVQSLAEEVVVALDGVLPYEIIYVDDFSNDATAGRLQALAAQYQNLRVVTHSKNRGQSAAVVNGVRRAKYLWIGTLDGDRQNDPKDLRLLIDAVNAEAKSKLLCMGQRVGRKDTWLRRVSSRIANSVRTSLLKDQCVDSGCGIKIFSRDDFLSLPLFKNCHRFLPVLFRRAGIKMISVEVSHRERTEGQSKYGVMNRLWAGIVDLFGVSWLMRRFIEIESEKDV